MPLVIRAAMAIGVCVSIGFGVPASADGDEISGPPVINPAFGSRMPRTCNPVKHLPSEAEAAALVQCAVESGGEAGAFRPLIYLFQNVRVQIGRPRPYIYDQDSRSTGIDTDAPVYPIRVSADHVSCTGQPACKQQRVSNSDGTCYRTSFEDWRCNFRIVFVTNSESEVPPPTTY